VCVDLDEGCLDLRHESPIHKLNSTEVNDIEYVLTKANLRELYDKTEQFVRKRVDPQMVPSEGARYLGALSEVSSYSMFVIMMFLFVEKH
jgi:hypothetical protein